MNMPATDQSPAAGAPPGDELRRYGVVTASVAIWMALGWTFALGGDAYVLLGVPLLWLFQRYVARRPLFEVWFAEPGRFTLPWWCWQGPIREGQDLGFGVHFNFFRRAGSGSRVHAATLRLTS
jgi:hypothetical protein